jgi:hypothetical protein
VVCVGGGRSCSVLEEEDQSMFQRWKITVSVGGEGAWIFAGSY